MKQHRPIMFMYILPLIYISMYCDIAYRVVSPYVISVAIFIILLAVNIKQKSYTNFIAGHIISFAVSRGLIYLLHHSSIEKWSAYFKCVTPAYFLLLIHFAMAVVGTLIYIFALHFKDSQGDHL